MADNEVIETSVEESPEDLEKDETVETAEEDESKEAVDETEQESSEEKSDDSEETEDDSGEYPEEESEYIKQFGFDEDITDIHSALTKASELLSQKEEKPMPETEGEKPSPTPDKLPQYVSAVETVNKNIQTGELSDDDAKLLMPLAIKFDEMTGILGYGLQQAYQKIEQLSQGTQTLTSRQRNIDYHNFVREMKKNKVRPLRQEELDKAMELPGIDTYTKAQAYVLAKDPNKAAWFYTSLKKNAEKTKKFRFKKGLKPKGKSTQTNILSYDHYHIGDGNMSSEFWKLPKKEQDAILDEKLGKARR